MSDGDCKPTVVFYMMIEAHHISLKSNRFHERSSSSSHIDLEATAQKNRGNT